MHHLLIINTDNMDENNYKQPTQQGTQYPPQQPVQPQQGVQYPPQQPVQQIYHINPPQNKSNGVGTAGFVLALLGLILCWVPVLGWILWLLGLILSAVGMSKQPKGLATAGLVISLLGLVVSILVIVFAGAAAASFGLF